MNSQTSGAAASTNPGTDCREMAVAWFGDPTSSIGQQALEGLAGLPDAETSAQGVTDLIQSFRDEMMSRYTLMEAGRAKAANFPPSILIVEASPEQQPSGLPSLNELPRLARLCRGAKMKVLQRQTSRQGSTA